MKCETTSNGDGPQRRVVDFGRCPYERMGSNANRSSVGRRAARRTTSFGKGTGAAATGWEGIDGVMVKLKRMFAVVALPESSEIFPALIWSQYWPAGCWVLILTTR